MFSAMNVLNNTFYKLEYLSIFTLEKKINSVGTIPPPPPPPPRKIQLFLSQKQNNVKLH